MLYIVTKKYRKRIFLKLLCIKDNHIKENLKKLDITDII